MSRGETFDQVGSLSLCLRRVRAKIISGSTSLREGRKERREEKGEESNYNFILRRRQILALASTRTTIKYTP